MLEHCAPVSDGEDSHEAVGLEWQRVGEEDPVVGLRLLLVEQVPVRSQAPSVSVKHQQSSAVAEWLRVLLVSVLLPVQPGHGALQQDPGREVSELLRGEAGPVLGPVLAQPQSRLARPARHSDTDHRLLRSAQISRASVMSCLN